jgi:hypothetical protein
LKEFVIKFGFRETIYVLAIHHGTQDYRLMLGKITRKTFSVVLFEDFLGVFSLNHAGVQMVSFIYLANHLNIRVSFKQSFKTKLQNFH